MEEQVICNKYWPNADPVISVFTTVYNRRSTIKRAIDSVERQTYRNFEYVIVNDGSRENIDDIVSDFMNHTQIPVMYIKKANGGVHTARNRAIRAVRGIYQTEVDSDDELTPDALETFLNTWKRIPRDDQDKYREIVAQCMDENGNRVGKPFPDGINQLPWDMARKLCDATGGEHIGCNLTKIRKENYWPEPEGITHVSPDILWKKLDQSYKSYYINDIVRIYHTETEGSISNSKVRSVQYCKNHQWMQCYYLNHSDIYVETMKRYWKTILKYNVFTHILKFNEISKQAKLSKMRDKIVSVIVWLPTYIVAKIYVKKKM
jgi:glycosyltransferase involved in cell wall biosynthesis